MNLNIRVEVRVDVNVEPIGWWTDGRTNGWKTGSLYRAILKACATITPELSPDTEINQQSHIIQYIQKYSMIL